MTIGTENFNSESGIGYSGPHRLTPSAGLGLLIRLSWQLSGLIRRLAVVVIQSKTPAVETVQQLLSDYPLWLPP